MEILREHIPIAFGISRVCTKECLSAEPYVYVGKDCISKFVHKLHEEFGKIKKMHSSGANKIRMTPKEKIMHKNAKKCKICSRPFSSQQKR